MKTLSPKIFATEKEEDRSYFLPGTMSTIWKDDDGLLHREDGPAVIGADGYWAWYKRDRFHREDGPAICHANGNTFYYLDGTFLTEEKFLSLKKKP
jgi:hypothetical protein